MTVTASALMKFLCDAMALEERERIFFSDAATSCPNELGREVFRMLAQEEAEQARGLKEIHDTLSASRKWPASCAIFSKSTKEVRKSFNTLTAKHKDTIMAGVTTPEALQLGVDLEKESLGFYEGHARTARDEEEKRLIKALVEEERAHLLMLLDMQQFYSDPEGYFMDKEHRGLDGA